MCRAGSAETLHSTYAAVLQNHLTSRLVDAYLEVIFAVWRKAKRRASRGAKLMQRFETEEELRIVFLEGFCLLMTQTPTHEMTWQTDMSSVIGKRLELAWVVLRAELSRDYLTGLKMYLHGDLNLDLVYRRITDKGFLATQGLRWTHTERRMLGLMVLEGVVTVAPELYRLRAGLRGRFRQYYIQYEPAYWEMLDRWQELQFLYRPATMPMVLPPRDWTNQLDGGFHHTTTQVLSTEEHLYRGHTRLADASVLASVNVLQRQAFRLDTEMVDLSRAIWDQGHEIGGLPSKFRMEPPDDSVFREKKLGPTAFWETMYRWKEDKAKDSARGRFINGLQQVDLLPPGADLYFVHHLDYRGRIYQRSSAINYQAGDLYRSWLEWARKAPSKGNEEAMAYVLGEHARLPPDRRVRTTWAEQHRELVKAVSRDPLAHVGVWSGMKNPWRFVQACRELALAWADPSHMTGLICQLDQTTSGFGHVACCLGQEGLATDANVIGQLRGDIYTTIATLAHARATRELTNGLLDDETREAYAWWLEKWPDRKLFKACVMPRLYGARYQSTANACLDWVRGMTNNLRTPEGLSTSRLAYKLGSLIWEVSSERLAAIKEFQQWVSTYCKAWAAADRDPQWPTPSGLLVSQIHRMSDRKVLKLQLAGRDIAVQVQESNGLRRTPKSWTKAAADFAHGLDASFAHQFVTHWDRMTDAPLAAVHDCFATDVAHLGVLQKELRDQFSRMYLECNPLKLALLYAQVELGEEACSKLWLPERGFEMDRVGENPHLFS